MASTISSGSFVIITCAPCCEKCTDKSYAQDGLTSLLALLASVGEEDVWVGAESCSPSAPVEIVEETFVGAEGGKSSAPVESVGQDWFGAEGGKSSAPVESVGQGWFGAEGGKSSAPAGRVGEGWGDAEIGVSAPVGSEEMLTIVMSLILSRPSQILAFLERLLDE
jgi:hypothetical protein